MGKAQGGHMKRIALMPHGAWPRGLSRELAAAYRGVSVNTFLSMVEAGTMPKPETWGRRKIWDRNQIDEAWDNQHETGSDPLMEALNDIET